VIFLSYSLLSHAYGSALLASASFLGRAGALTVAKNTLIYYPSDSLSTVTESPECTSTTFPTKSLIVDLLCLLSSGLKSFHILDLLV
jgi:hypothetical protein